MTAADSSHSMSSINSGITGMDRGFRFQTEPESPGALGSYLRAQGPLDMVESGRLSLEQSRVWSNSANAGTILTSIYLVNVIKRWFFDYVNINSVSCPPWYSKYPPPCKGSKGSECREMPNIFAHSLYPAPSTELATW